jgi:hypothetical protein
LGERRGVEKGARTGIDLKHNRRYGGDCVPRLGLGDRRRDCSPPPKRGTPSSSRPRRPDRVRIEAGREANDGASEAETLCGERVNRIPKRRVFEAGPLPFSLPRLSARRWPLSRLPYGANSAVLTGATSSPRETLSRDGGMGALWIGRSSPTQPSGLPLVGSEIVEVYRQTKHFFLDRDGLLIEDAEKTEKNAEISEGSLRVISVLSVAPRLKALAGCAAIAYYKWT